MLIFPSAKAQLALSTQFINPCGGDEHNEFIMAKSAVFDVAIYSIFFGSYNPSTNPNGVVGAHLLLTTTTGGQGKQTVQANY